MVWQEVESQKNKDNMCRICNEAQRLWPYRIYKGMVQGEGGRRYLASCYFQEGCLQQAWDRLSRPPEDL